MPDAANNEDALECVERLKKPKGEAKFRKRHGVCYKAHEKYEEQTEQEEAGEAEEG